MFKITLYNDNEKVIIHEPYISKTKRKIKSGQVTLGINTIDTFSFSLYPTNQGFNKLYDYKTEIRVFDTKNKKNVFDGRILQSKKSMSDSGLIYKEITCENLMGYLCDSKQPYIEEKNWSTLRLFTILINNHNDQVESKKYINLGDVSYLSSEDNIYIGIQRENTWDAIKTKLIDKIGGEVKVYRHSDGNIYIDYVEKFGEYKTTSICLKRNMKSIDNESDPSSFVTRLIPLGAKIKEIVTDTNGNTSEKESDQRIDITSVNNGLNYIDDIEAKKKYGIIVGYQYWDDVTEPLNLLNKGKKFLSENNKIVQKYMVSALDLSLIGKDANSFDIYNYYDIKNHLLGINEKLRIIKKTIDILNFQNSTFEFGDLSKTLSEIQINSEIALEDKIKNIEANYIKNKEINNIISYQIENSSLIKQLPEDILLQVKENYYTKNQTDKENEILNKKIADIELNADSIRAEVSEKIGNDEIISSLNLAIRNGLGIIEFLANQFKVSSDHLIINEYGDIIAENAEFNNALLRGGNLLLKDDGTQDGASLKIEVNDSGGKRVTSYSGKGIVADIVIPYDFSEEDVQYIEDSGWDSVSKSFSNLSDEEIQKYDLDGNGYVDMFDIEIINNIIYAYEDYGIYPGTSGKFIINTTPNIEELDIGNSSNEIKNIIIKNGYGDEVFSLGPKGIRINNNTLDQLYGANNILWQANNSPGGYYMTAEHNVTLSEKVSEQAHGIILVWWAFNPETQKLVGGPVVQQVIPKYLISDSAMTFHQDMHYANFTYSGTKVVYITDSSISGNNGNTAVGTGNSGIKYNNNRFVLSYVIGF